MLPDVLVVEFKPDQKDALGRLVKDITGQSYAHSGMVVGDRYYELEGRIQGSVMRYAYAGTQDLQVMRGRKTGANDTLEFYALPREVTPVDVQRLISAWEADIAANEPFGWWNMISFAFKIPYRRLCAWVLDHLKIRLPGVEKVFRAHWLCCSASVCEKLRVIGIDLFPGERNEDIYPGRFAHVLRRVA